MKKIAIVALLSVFAATPAWADNTGKFYVAGDLGAASYTNATITVNGTVNTFANPGMMRVAAGYHFSPMWAAEMGYASFADSTLTGASGNITLGVSSAHVAAVATYPLASQFDLTAKLGVSSNSYTITTTGAFAGQGSSGSKTDLLLGVGAQYHFNSQYTLRAQYESFGAITSGSSPAKAAALSVGVAYNF